MLLMYWRRVMNKDCPQGIKNEKEIEKLDQRYEMMFTRMIEGQEWVVIPAASSYTVSP